MLSYLIREVPRSPGEALHEHMHNTFRIALSDSVEISMLGWTVSMLNERALNGDDERYGVDVLIVCLVLRSPMKAQLLHWSWFAQPNPLI